ncbi:NDR1/HIN1-like protein 26 [Salvia divinorum]|uniref:NDR1/HIN1-like protein 26 n=1 Tax=Salvia divinorum TaxID=28513 RepID=A0ABD1H2K1_SALDI
MSIIHEKSPKHCAEKQTTKILNKSKKKLLFYSLMFFLSILCLILLLRFILHPSNPHFSLTQVDINHLNITSPSPFLNSSIHLTLLSTNPNKRTGIYYDGFLLHASYNSHVITPDTSIPPFFQDHQQPNLLSASLLGNHHHVDPSLAAGKLPLGFTATGSLRWKVGNWVSRRYGFSVDCVTVLPLGRRDSTPLTSKQPTVCSTSI